MYEITFMYLQWDKSDNKFSKLRGITFSILFVCVD